MILSIFMLTFRHKYLIMPLIPATLGQALAAVRRQVHYNNGGATLTAQQENAIVYGATQEAIAIHAFILTGTVNSVVNATITVPPAVQGTAVGIIT